MFTGIIEEVGEIKTIKRSQKFAVLSIEGDTIFSDLKVGHSVAVNGVCLTVVSLSNNTFTADIMSETLDRSSLGSLKSGSKVNLERAMDASGRFGGHIVSGHIDGIGFITSIKEDANAIWYTISCSDKLLCYIVEKGSITIDGISLTVAKVTNSNFTVSIIPHTAKSTILSERSVTDKVNLENDVIAKYIEKFIINKSKSNNSNITSDFLKKTGFIY
ncbi:riboflavin synthase [Clostridium algidicarnis]|uniref:riboflavin synthase n=1 Tax=Clostridium algidicarnis TaxID=37659 RepID=UPI003FD7CDCE